MTPHSTRSASRFPLNRFPGDRSDVPLGGSAGKRKVLPFLAFFATVFGSVAAAAAVVTNVPLTVMGLWS